MIIQERGFQKSKLLFSIMLFPFLLTFLPRPPIENAHFLTYPLIGGVIILYFLIHLRGLYISGKVSSLIILYSLLAVSMCISILISENIGWTLLAHVGKPVLFSLILVFGYMIGEKFSFQQIKKGLLNSAYIILIAQVIIGIPQLVGSPILSFLYDTEMTRPIGEKIRIVGTFGNPNFFAWFIIQMVVIIFLFEANIKKKLIGFVIGTLLILLSGSRTFLILFPIILFVSVFLKSRKTIAFYFTRLPFLLILLSFSFFVTYWFIFTYGKYFPYLSQLMLIFETGDLRSVESFELRTEIWGDAWNIFLIEGTFQNLLFGLGPGYFEFLDNDFLYSVISYGVVGLLLIIAINLYLYIAFSRIVNREFGALGKQYIIFSILVGLQADTLSGWNYPMLLMFYAGLAFSLSRISNENLSEIKVYKG